MSPVVTIVIVFYAGAVVTLSKSLHTGPCRPMVLCPQVLANPDSSCACSLPDGSIGARCHLPIVNELDLFTRQCRASIISRQFNTEVAYQSCELALERASLDTDNSTEVFFEVPESLYAETYKRINMSSDERNSEPESRTVNRIRGRPACFGSQCIQPVTLSPTFLANLNSLSSDFAQYLGRQASRQNVILSATLDSITQLDRRDSLGILARRKRSPTRLQKSSPEITTVPNCTIKSRPVCKRCLYRSITGECNNLFDSQRGKSLGGLGRLLPNTYEDGIFEMRSTGASGNRLPSARLVSQVTIDSSKQEEKRFTLSLMQWGQFVDHDLSHSLIFRRADNSSIECCENEGRIYPAKKKHTQCIPIEISPDDPFYNGYGQRCMNMVRSLPFPDPNCRFRSSTPINELTAYLDSSNVYGSQPEEAKALRSFVNGKLLTSEKHLLPIGQRTPSMPSCRTEKCFVAGDSRVNEQSGLAVMHTIFMREHNRIAEHLHRANPRLRDEKIFQEARRILNAEWQHIVYNEWLPNVIGFEYAREYALLPLRRMHSVFYDEAIDPSIYNEFSTAAFRFGHSMVTDKIVLFEKNNGPKTSINITQTFFNPDIIFSKFSQHARALVHMKPQTFGSSVASSLSQRLFTTNSMFGLDLVALNIQRGRDHGIPTYKSMLFKCTGLKIKTWSDLKKTMETKHIIRLQKVYESPDDIDLFIGGLLERSAPGAIVGVTFQCIIGRQFFNLRYGDRFFYDNAGFEHSFTMRQLAEIRKSNWARLLCDTLGKEFSGDWIKVQPLAFIPTSIGANKQASCDSLAIPKVNLSVFK